MFHSLKENVFQWGKIRKIEKLNTEVSAILKDLVNGKKQDAVLKKILEMASTHMTFETCMLYEWLPGNKLKKLYSDISYQSVLKYKEKFIFRNKKSLLKGNDLSFTDDEGAVYHPVVIGKKMRYIFIFDGVDMEYYEENRKDRAMFYQDLELVMGNLRNRTLANRAPYMDSLTELPNERQLRKDMEYCIVSEKDYIFAIIELDDMKKLNEKYGMEFGDRVIKTAKGIVECHVRSGDGVYRFIGARLAVLLSGTQEKQFRIIRNIHDELCSTEIATGKTGAALCPVTIGALEVRYLEEKSVDYAYERCRHALTVEKGGICFVGERRELQSYEEKGCDTQEDLENVDDIEEVTDSTVEVVKKEEDTLIETLHKKICEQKLEEYTEQGETRDVVEEQVQEQSLMECEEDFAEYSDADISDVVNEGGTGEEYSGTDESENILSEQIEAILSEMEEAVETEEIEEKEKTEQGSETTLPDEICIDTLSISLPPELPEYNSEVSVERDVDCKEPKGTVSQEGPVTNNDDVSEKKKSFLNMTASSESKIPEQKKDVQSTMLDILQADDNEEKKTVKLVNISEVTSKKRGRRRKEKREDSNVYGKMFLTN